MTEEYILGLFEEREHAEQAIESLQEHDELGEVEYGLFARHEDLREGLDAEGEEEGMVKGAAAGAAAGAGAGLYVGTVAGLTLLLFPGLGTLLAAGPLASALASAAAGVGIGGTAGGFMGGLIGFGATEEEANFYIEGIEQGGVLLAVKTIENQTTTIGRIMEDNGVVNAEARRDEWIARTQPHAS